MVALILCSSVALAFAPSRDVDLGAAGAVYEIAEDDYLEVLQAKLEAERPRYEAEVGKMVRDYVRRPQAVVGVGHATSEREWRYSPSITLPEDIRDPRDGRVLLFAGTTVNTFDHVTWPGPMLLIDGDSKEEVAWAEVQMKHVSKATVVLVAGSPPELRERFGRPVYFDQAGQITRTLQVHATPALIEQDGRYLRIREIPLARRAGRVD